MLLFAIRMSRSPAPVTKIPVLSPLLGVSSMLPPRITLPAIVPGPRMIASAD